MIQTFERQAFRDLLIWKNKPDRKPLILRGARQVGKTTLVNQFSAQYDHFISLNLDREKDRLLFARFDDVETAVQAIFFEYGISMQAQQVLIFIDEVQMEPKAVRWLRYFYELFPQWHVIAAGSLLESLMHSQQPFPVGRVEYMILRPASFSEFLRATDQAHLADALRLLPLPDYMLPKLFEQFALYGLIGGMPEAVKAYAQHKDLILLRPIYQSLLTAYQDDVLKYARNERNTQHIATAIRSMFSEAGTRIKFEDFGRSGYDSKSMSEALRSIEKALLCQLVFPLTDTQMPPLPDHKRKPYLQVLDSGLMNFFNGWQSDMIGINDLQPLYKGRIVQHLVGQEIQTTQIHPEDKLHFWTREKTSSQAEVDFVIPHQGLLIPVEVKSGSTGHLKSLLSYMDSAPHAIAVRLYYGKVDIHPLILPSGKTIKLINLPYFMGAYVEQYI
jgi:uncharacterized protein